jgi:predicted TPR repeat methyltransferase
MNPSDAIQVHEQYAADYDRLATEDGYVAPEALFGLCFEFLRPRQHLLDIGIGTGLSSLPFARAGLAVYGLDGSAEMLKECEEKHFAAGLEVWDLRVSPWPYADQFFDHVIECGTLPFLSELEVVFSEAARLVRPRGIFAFTVKEPKSDLNTGASTDKHTSENIDGVPIYSHSPAYITTLLAGCSFEKRKQFKFLLPRGPGLQDDVYRMCVVQKMGTKD